jgi:uncharacterized RDD family membrane protein YckC
MSDNLPDPATNPELYEGVLTRRVLAFLVDMVIVGIALGVATIVGGIIGFLTFGIGWLVTLVVLPVIVIGYYAVTLGSPARATIGMQMMDIVLTPTRGQPLDGPVAFVHTLLFWITAWIAWPISLIVALFTPRRQMVHDYLAGTLMLRRSPMVRHWYTLRQFS